MQLPGSLGTLIDLMVFLLGFGFIVFVHELGHFAAARWAGIRVLAFAVGLGPALVSFRGGLGLRFGSSEGEYRARAKAGQGASLSPTEYRFNWLPFGGYVKMLGQEDLDPGAASAAPDSFQNCAPWKRLVVISAGVVMNILLAASLFVIVFMAGLKTEPAIIGRVYPGSPAALAVPVSGADAANAEPGLRPGDRVLRIDGDPVREFGDIVLATTMGHRGRAIEFEVQRAGAAGVRRFQVTPEVGRQSGLQEIGVEPARSGRILSARPGDEAQASGLLARAGLAGVRPGMTLAQVDGAPVTKGFADLDRAMRESEGRDVRARFSAPDVGRDVDVSLTPRAAMQEAFVPGPAESLSPMEHLLGLIPVMKVADVDDPAYKRGREQGLATGDIIARVGSVEYPSAARGMLEIRANKGSRVDIEVIRRGADGRPSRVSLSASVTGKGTIGFLAGNTSDDGVIVALPPAKMYQVGGVSTGGIGGGKVDSSVPPGMREFVPPAIGIISQPGLRIEMVGGHAVGSFAQLRAALREATHEAWEQHAESAQVTLGVRFPNADGSYDARVRPLAWTLGREAIESLHSLGWENPVSPSLFVPEEFLLKGSTPLEALKLGVLRTHAVMMNTYATFARLFERTVKIEHLKGPVGIAQMGTMVAERGSVWTLFFLALLSINLAVINFLPLPIVDGGQFLLILFEQLRGKPAPIAVQNGLTLAGIVLIGSLFIIVTFNDIRNLLGM